MMNIDHNFLLMAIQPIPYPLYDLPFKFMSLQSGYKNGTWDHVSGLVEVIRYMTSVSHKGICEKFCSKILENLWKLSKQRNCLLMLSLHHISPDPSDMICPW